MTSVKKSTVLVSILTIVALVCLWTSDSGSISTTKKQLDLKSGPSISSDSLNFTKYTPVDGVTGKNRTPYWKPTPREVGVSISATVYGHGYAKATMNSASIGSWSLSDSEYSTADAGSGPVFFGVTVQRMGEATVSHKTTSELTHKDKGNYNWSGNGSVERFAAEWREGSSSGFFNFGTTGKWHFVGVGSNNADGNGSWSVIHNYECQSCNTLSDDPLTAPHKLKTWKCGHSTMGCLSASHGDTTITCPLGPNNQTCDYGSYYPCSPHEHVYSSSSGSGCANAPGQTYCNDKGSCATRSGSGVPGVCGHEWCSCSSNGSNPPSGSTPPSGGSTPPSGGGSTPPSGGGSTPAMVECSRGGCNSMVLTSTDHRSSCNQGHTYWPGCPAHANTWWHQSSTHTEKTCRRYGCSNKWYPCQRTKPNCSVRRGRLCLGG